MVKFNDKSFTIEVVTNCNPIEDWLNTHEELIDLLQCADPEMLCGRTHQRVLELLRCMMPDLETAKKMTK